MKDSNHLSEIRWLDIEIERLDREIKWHARWTLFWGFCFCGGGVTSLIIIAYLIRILVIG